MDEFDGFNEANRLTFWDMLVGLACTLFCLGVVLVLLLSSPDPLPPRIDPTMQPFPVQTQYQP